MKALRLWLLVTGPSASMSRYVSNHRSHISPGGRELRRGGRGSLVLGGII
jgi:hypothetical protein